MIYDLFMFNNEVEILEVRLNYLVDVVDYFIIIESTRTFSNIKKKLFLNENWDKFDRFRDKIIHLIFDGPFSENAWENENRQRNLLLTEYRHFKIGDLIIHGDLDEIPNKKLLNKITSIYPSNSHHVYSSILINYIYNPYHISHNLWLYQKVFFWDYVEAYKEPIDSSNYNKFLIKDINQGFTLMKIRFLREYKLLSHVGWHLSYFGDIDFIFNKLKSFSHHDEFDLKHHDIENLINNSKFVDGKKLSRIERDYFGIQQILPKVDYPLNFRFDKLYLNLTVKIFILNRVTHSTFFRLVIKQSPRRLKIFIVKFLTTF